jgi:hypothetical protein
VLSPLKGLVQLVTGYEKLSLRFTKYAEMIYLLVWFADPPLLINYSVSNLLSADFRTDITP